MTTKTENLALKHCLSVQQGVLEVSEPLSVTMISNTEQMSHKRDTKQIYLQLTDKKKKISKLTLRKGNVKW